MLITSNIKLVAGVLCLSVSVFWQFHIIKMPQLWNIRALRKKTPGFPVIIRTCRLNINIIY